MSEKVKPMENNEAWDYAIGLVQVEGITPSEDFLALVEKEKQGELTNDDIRKVLLKKYQVVEDAAS
ncbi:MAG: antitoxin VbhA family protein [Oscillospiraceae bacterium]|nr:antitoxin VbhA family protein [Oscillospiraceae bacterium]